MRYVRTMLRERSKIKERDWPKIVGVQNRFLASGALDNLEGKDEFAGIAGATRGK